MQRYQLLCANRQESKFEELVRKHKNIQQMYGVVGHQLDSQEGLDEEGMPYDVSTMEH